MKTALYRHFDKGGSLLYIGISLSPVARLAQHDAQSSWAEKIAKVTISYFDDRESAATAEADAIRRERPLYNVVYNGKNTNRKRRRSDLDDLDLDVRKFDKTTNQISDLLYAYKVHGVLVETLSAVRHKLANDNKRKHASVIDAIDKALSL